MSDTCQMILLVSVESHMDISLHHKITLKFITISKVVSQSPENSFIEVCGTMNKIFLYHT